MQAQHRKIEGLEDELRKTRAKLDESETSNSEVLQRHAEMQQEIENNAGSSASRDLMIILMDQNLLPFVETECLELLCC